MSKTLAFRRPSDRALALAGLCAAVGVAAANFGWQLGSSSFFVDEVISVQHATVPLHLLFSVVRRFESTPPTYFLFLHEWFGRTGLAPHEWVLRLPSAVAGVGLVGIVCWLGRELGGWRVGILAGLLTALSPLVLQYAQQGRVYALLMLTTAAMVLAALRADHAPRRQGAWLAVAAALGVLCMWLHYTGAIAVAVLGVWVVANRRFSARARALVAVAWLASAGALFPVLHAQYTANPNGGLVGLAGLTGRNTLRVIGTPFDSRAYRPLDALDWLGAGAVVAGLAIVALRRQVPHRWLLLALAMAPPAVMLVLSAAGKDVMITRYTALAAPFMLLAIAAAVLTAPRPLGIALLAAALVPAVVVTAKSHRATGFYVNARAAIDYIARARAPEDVIVTPGQADPDVQLTYYGARRLQPTPTYVSGTQPAAVKHAIAQRRRLWIIALGDHQQAKAAPANLASIGYRLLKINIFPANVSLLVILATAA